MIDRAWQEHVRRLLEADYLSASDSRGQSGFRGDAARWERARRITTKAVERDGSFLDVGCANGLLMESIVSWAAEDGWRLEPYGLDILESMVQLARRRLPHWADRIFYGDAMRWRPAQRFDLVYAHVDLAPAERLPALVHRLLDEVTAPGGRLILGSYGSSSRRQPPTSVADLLHSSGFTVAGAAEARDDDGSLLTKVAWVQVPASAAASQRIP